MSEKLEQALMRLYLARKARREASRAMAKYLAEAWGETEGDEYGPGWRDPKAHRFGACQLGTTGNPRDPQDPGAPILCPVCSGSAPLHAAYVTASRDAGNALRQCQAIGQRFAREQGLA